MSKRCPINMFFFLLVSACLPAGAQKNRLDVSLRGPWILYVDHSFAKHPVLIAMAPPVDHDHPWSHKAALVSTGDAYFLDDPTKDVSRIYCLTFDDACARKGPGSLKFDGYPDRVQLLNPKLPGSTPDWDWVTASSLHNAPTLILPMPDSYSSDGVWHMRFSNHFDAKGIGYGGDEQHSIGLQLHYKSGPSKFDLLVCEAKQPTVENCTKKANLKGHTRLDNSGTLRIEMKAPDTDSACDPHVRRIYPKMLELISTPSTKPSVNADIAIIDPAQGVNSDGSGRYDQFPAGYSSLKANPAIPNSSPYCLEHDSQGEYNDDIEKDPQAGSADPDLAWYKGLLDLVDKINRLPELDKEQIKQKYYLDQIEDQAADLSFPKLSQLRRIETLLILSEAELKVDLAGREPVIAGNAVNTNTPRSTLVEFKDSIAKILLMKPPPKSGGDCLAALMRVGK